MPGSMSGFGRKSLLTIPPVPEQFKRFKVTKVKLLNDNHEDEKSVVVWEPIKSEHQKRREENEAFERKILSCLPCTSGEFQAMGYTGEYFDNGTKRLKKKGLIVCKGRIWYSTEKKLP